MFGVCRDLSRDVQMIVICNVKETAAADCTSISVPSDDLIVCWFEIFRSRRDSVIARMLKRHPRSNNFTSSALFLRRRIFKSSQVKFFFQYHCENYKLVSHIQRVNTGIWYLLPRITMKLILLGSNKYGIVVLTRHKHKNNFMSDEKGWAAVIFPQINSSRLVQMNLYLNSFLQLRALLKSFLLVSVRDSLM